MALKCTLVSKCLDKKLRIAGFEIPDLLILFLMVSILNFVFGQTEMTLFLVWMPSVMLAAVLYFGKKGKPDNYLVHWLRFQFRPGVLRGFPEPSFSNPPPTLKGGVHE
jgi:hypothetical protein